MDDNDDGRKVMTKAHMAKNDLVFQFANRLFS